MKYMLMMNTMTAGSTGLNGWPEKDIKSMVGFMMDLDKELRTSGELVFEEGLTFPNEAKLVQADKNGMPITDGVFPESKEFLAGFWIVDVVGPERAYSIAARISMCPGPGGSRLKCGRLELRRRRNDRGECGACARLCGRYLRSVTAAPMAMCSSSPRVCPVLPLPTTSERPE